MEFHTNTLFFITICLLNLVVCQNIICNPNNNFVSDPLVLPLLNGLYYMVYTTAPTLGNQIFKFKPDKQNNAIWAHTTDDSGCCKTIYMSTVQQQPGGYYNDWFATDPNCPTQFNETVMYKPLFSNSVQVGLSGILGSLIGGLLDSLLNSVLNSLEVQNLCVALWVCRASREGVHIFCKSSTISPASATWIQQIALQLNVTFVPIVQNNTSLASSDCIAKF